MAKEDFCFTYYDGDAARDKAHMNRLQRGAYDDIISAQRKRGHLSVDDVKRVLSGDFDLCWPALEWILKVDEAGKYFIEWLENSLQRSKKHSAKQSENGKNGGRPRKYKPSENPEESQLKPKHNPTESQKKPLGDGDGDEDEDEEESEEGGTGETKPIGIVPDMLLEFEKSNPGYPANSQKDFPALRSIAEQVIDWQKLSGDITAPKNAEAIKFRWGELLPFIRAHTLFGGYSLSQVEKYFQSIVQSFNSTKHGTHSKTSRSAPVISNVPEGGFGQL